MVNRRGVVLACSAVLGLTACAGMDVSRQTVQSFELTTARLRGDAAFGALTAVFVDRGFDVKVTNKEGGVVSTEYKKFASAGSSPPFDYYLQIRATVRDAGNGQTMIRLSPMVKEQNRTNAAAFTERELHYYEGTPQAVRMADRGGWATSGQTMFMNIVSDLSNRAGVPMDGVKKNITTTTVNAMLPSQR